MKVVLGSSSPRRKELLSNIVSNFDIDSPQVDESLNRPSNVYDVPLKLSLFKALDVQKRHRESIIIASDSVVILDDQILEKPKDHADALRMLKLLNNNKHYVVTGVCIVYKEKVINYIEKALVVFNNLSEETLKYYVSTNDPMDKAGAYGIQNPYVALVSHYEGEYETIVGLPLKRLKFELENLINEKD